MKKQKGFGIIIILITLLIVAVLAYFNWDKVVQKKDAIDESREKASETLENVKEQTRELEEKMKKRVEDGLDKIKE